MTDAPAPRRTNVREWIGPMREVSPGRFEAIIAVAWTEEIDTAEDAAISSVAMVHQLNEAFASADDRFEPGESLVYSAEEGDSPGFVSEIIFREEKLSVWVRSKTQPRSSAVTDAMAAREAAIEGDHEVVDAFAATWMPATRAASGQWRSALAQALIADWTSALTSDGAEERLMALLISEMRAAHRQLQPIWERKAAGHRVHLLDKPVADGLALRDLVTDRVTPEETVLRGVVDHADLNAVLRSLTPVERKIAQTWAMCPGSSWREAAELADISEDPEALGARVMRKLKRLGNRHAQRCSSAQATIAQSKATGGGQ